MLPLARFTNDFGHAVCVCADDVAVLAPRYSADSHRTWSAERRTVVGTEITLRNLVRVQVMEQPDEVAATLVKASQDAELRGFVGPAAGAPDA